MADTAHSRALAELEKVSSGIRRQRLQKFLPTKPSQGEALSADDSSGSTEPEAVSDEEMEKLRELYSRKE